MNGPWYYPVIGCSVTSNFVKFNIFQLSHWPLLEVKGLIVQIKININNSSQRNARNATHTSHLENINAKPLAFFFSIATIHAFTLLSNSHEASESFLFTVPLPTHKPSFWRVTAGFATCLVRYVRVHYMFATNMPSSLLSLFCPNYTIL